MAPTCSLGRTLGRELNPVRRVHSRENTKNLMEILFIAFLEMWIISLTVANFHGTIITPPHAFTKCSLNSPCTQCTSGFNYTVISRIISFPNNIKTYKLDQRMHVGSEITIRSNMWLTVDKWRGSKEIVIKFIQLHLTKQNTINPMSQYMILITHPHHQPS